MEFIRKEVKVFKSEDKIMTFTGIVLFCCYIGKFEIYNKEGKQVQCPRYYVGIDPALREDLVEVVGR